MRVRLILVVLLIAVVGASLLCMGCRRGTDTEARTTGQVAEVSADKPSPEPAKSPEGSKPSAASTTEQPKPAEKPVLETPKEIKPETPKPTDGGAKPPPPPAPPALVIDTEDSKYVEGPRPELPIDGKPAEITYHPPRMFSLDFTKSNAKDETRGITFATMSISDEQGMDFQIHLLLRDGAKPIVPFFKLTSSEIKVGETWTKPCGDFTVEVKMLDVGITPGFPKGTLNWIKVQVKARK